MVTECGQGWQKVDRLKEMAIGDTRWTLVTES